MFVQCYKHVCALLDRHMKKAKPAQRLNAFFLISAICRHSMKKHNLQDKYSTFLTATSCHKLPCKDLQQQRCFSCSKKMGCKHCRAYRVAARHFCRADGKLLHQLSVSCADNRMMDSLHARQQYPVQIRYHACSGPSGEGAYFLEEGESLLRCSNKLLYGCSWIAQPASHCSIDSKPSQAFGRPGRLCTPA